MLLENKTHVN